MIKNGIYYAYWTKDWNSDFLPFIKKVKSLGFDLLEVNAGSLPQLSLQEQYKLKGVAEENNIALSCCVGLTPDVDPSSADTSIRKKGIDFLNMIADSMVNCGIQKLSGIIYSSWPGKLEPRGYSKEKIRDWSLQSMKEAIKKAEEMDLIYNVEVVNRFEQFLLNTAKEGVEYAQEVGSPNIKILLDTFHMNIEEDSFRDSILTAKDYLGHFHIGENNRRPPGAGMLPWDDIFSALKEIQYNNWIVMEPFISQGGEVGRDISVYREVMPGSNKDEEAKKASQFIQKKIEQYLV